MFQSPTLRRISLFLGITAIVTVSGFALTHHVFSRAYVHHILESEAALLLLQLEEHIGEGEEVIRSADAVLERICTEETRDQLIRFSFETPHVRSLNLALSESKYCSDLQKSLQIHVDNWTALDDAFSLGIGKNTFTNTFELLLKHGDIPGAIIADIEPVQLPRGMCKVSSPRLLVHL